MLNTDCTRREFLHRVSLGTALAAAALPNAFAQPANSIKLALVGVAHIHTPGFVNLLKTRKDAQVKSVWDHQPGRAEPHATELNAQVVSRIDEIWTDASIQAVLIGSETNRHRDLVLAATEAGKHLFVEKPLGINARESLAMARAIQKANLRFTTGYFMRADPKHLFLKDEIAKGHLGKITRARGSNCHSGSLAGWFDDQYRWMADPKIAGFGAFGDLGTHKLDILMWLFGAVDSVTAEIKPVTGRYPGCDETGEAMIRFKNGVIGTLAAGWVDVEDPVQLLISGTEGHATIVDNHLYYKSSKLSGVSSKDPYTNLPKGHRAPLHQFLDAVAGQAQPLVTAQEAAERVVVMEAMYRAARGKKWVEVG